MSSSAPSRSLPLIPFLAVDGMLLLTALFIAWRSSDDLAGGALLGVILCIGLGAVLTVLPFIINDAREREASLAERQRELVDLVNSTTAVSLRWGTQWTAAATGLDSAAGLATRSLAAAERLPEVFQEKIDAFARLLEQAELAAAARRERALHESAVLAERAQQAGGVAAAELEGTLAGFGRMEAGLREQHAAMVVTLAEATTTRAQTGAAVTQLERTLVGFDGLNAGLREQHSSLAATLAEIPLTTTRAQSAREELDARVSTASAQIEAHLARLATDADERLAGTTNALALRLAGLEAAIDILTRQLDRVNTLAAPAPAPVVDSPPAEPVAVAEPELVSAPAPAPEPVRAFVEPIVALPENTGITVSPVPVVEVPGAPLSRKETIMDPFYIPNDGYSALADAMDGGQP